LELQSTTKAKELKMTRLEKIARDLASVLSPEGESDWRRFVGMAEEVGTRLFKQFADILAPEAERGTDLHRAAKAG
jgi:hypothetical protein